MAFRPAGVDDGSRPAQKIPTSVLVTANYGDDPDRVASAAHFTFAPTDRAVVDLAVARFVATLEESDE